ncbi:hypothetical protein KBX00_10025 [Micromonospora sp. C95]|nr:hypothetical protein [Micromonospora sp. C95]
MNLSAPHVANDLVRDPNVVGSGRSSRGNEFGSSPWSGRVQFQATVADELADLHQQLRRLAQENNRLKRTLRDWQSMHARHCRPPNQGPW